MTSLRCTLCAKSWNVAYFGNVRSEQHKHDEAEHPELTAQQQALVEELQKLVGEPRPGRDVADFCSFCGQRVGSEHRRDHERSVHSIEESRARELSNKLSELDRHWVISR